MELGKKLGSEHDNPGEGRDAVHVPTISAQAYCEGGSLGPGQKVYYQAMSFPDVIVAAQPGLAEDEGATYNPGGVDQPLGIVDPFLKEPVYPGERFVMLVEPGTIKNLTHTWSHDIMGTPADEEIGDFDDGCRGCW